MTETISEKHEALPPLTPEELQTDRRIKTFISDIASRFINTEDIKPPAKDEEVRVNISRVRKTGDNGTVLENLHIAQRVSSYGNDPILEIYFTIPGVGSLSAENHSLPDGEGKPFHPRPKMIFFDVKTQEKLTGADALEAVSKVFRSSGFRSLPDK